MNPVFFEAPVDFSKKEDIVAFNPKKGKEFSDRIIAAANGKVKFVPIQDMTPAQVSDLLERSKVYIDFGEHPGKDRIPRESAMKGCCVIVGRRGSAEFFQDVPLEPRYKFDLNEFSPNAVVEVLKEIMNSFQECSKDFDRYRNIIRLNEKQFELEVEGIFGNAG